MKIIYIVFGIFLLFSCSFKFPSESGSMDFLPIGVDAEFTNLEIEGDYCFLASGPAGVRIVDCRNPFDLAFTKGFSDIDLDEFVRDLDVHQNKAYVLSNKRLRILDISDVSEISEIVSVDGITGNRIIYNNDTVFIGAAYPSSTSGENPLAGIDIVALDVSEPSIPAELFRIEAAPIMDLQVDDRNLYFIQNNGSGSDNTLKIFDMDDKTNPEIIYEKEYPYITAMCLFDGNIFILNETGTRRTSDFLQPMNIDMNGNVSFGTKFELDSNTANGTERIAPAGDNVLIAREQAVIIIDVSDFDSLVLHDKILKGIPMGALFSFQTLLSVQAMDDFICVIGIQGLYSYKLVGN